MMSTYYLKCDVVKKRC